MARGWAVEVTVLDGDRLPLATGTHWLKCAEAGQIAGTAYGASRGAKYSAWTRAQARAVARRQASIMARFARDSDGPDLAVLRDPEGDGEGDLWEIIEERGSMGQDPQPIAVCHARQVPYATAKYAPSAACAAASDPAAVAAMEARA